MKRLMIWAALAALPLAAQTARFTATTGDAVLSAAATALTVQKPASDGVTNGRDVTLESAFVYCSVACNVTQSYNGTAATATAGTVARLPPVGGAAATATAWTASNVGVGTSVGGIIHVGAGQTVVIDLSKLTLNGAGTGANYTVSVGTMSGTANITVTWSER
jgi:hypothetical protein